MLFSLASATPLGTESNRDVKEAMMLVEQVVPGDREDLAATIGRHIAERTWGRVRRLQVEVNEKGVVVRGCAPTYYVKQLALHAVREVLEAARMDVEIEVGASNSWSPHAWHEEW
jgi:hypothetical protein